MTPKMTLTARRVKGAPKPPSAKSPFKATSGSKFALFLGDEGVIAVHIRNKSVINRYYIPDTNATSLQDLHQQMATDSKAPIFLIIDSMDQSYIQQTLPPVSSFSTNKLIKRRLDRDFGSNDIKGAIVLGREKSGRKDWNFLMVSIERTPQLTAWLDFIGELPNPFAGIHLLSVETENIVKALEKSMNVPKEGTGSEWKFFVSHNKVGGFRQVILRNGRLIFTRMTQPIGESTPEVIAGNIEQEMSSTIEYMKRMGFSPQAGLDIYVIAADAVRNALDMARYGAHTVNMMTPYEVAQALGIDGATQPGDQFGDVVLATCIAAASSKHVLTLSTDAFTKQASYFQLISLQRMAGALAAVAMLGYIGWLAFQQFGIYQQSSELADKQSIMQRDLTALQEDVKKHQPNLEKTNDIIELYKVLLSEKLSPTPFFNYLAKTIPGDVRIKAIDWSLDSSKSKTAVSTPLPSVAPGGATLPFKLGKERVTALVTLEFPGIGSNAGKFKAVSENVLDVLKKAFPGFNVSFTQMPTGLQDNDKTEIDFSKTDEKPADSQKILEAQLTIGGFYIEEEVKAPEPAATTPEAAK